MDGIPQDILEERRQPPRLVIVCFPMLWHVLVYTVRVWHKSATRIQKSKADADDKREEVCSASCELQEEMLKHDEI